LGEIKSVALEVRGECGRMAKEEGEKRDRRRIGPVDEESQNHQNQDTFNGTYVA
jgi:hypothetical protein